MVISSVIFLVVFTGLGLAPSVSGKASTLSLLLLFSGHKSLSLRLLFFLPSHFPVAVLFRSCDQIAWTSPPSAADPVDTDEGSLAATSSLCLLQGE